MIRSAIAALFLMLPAFLPAQGPSARADATVQNPTGSSQVSSGTTVRDADGREVNVGAGGNATVRYEGKLKNHPTLENVKVCEKIVGVKVGSGGCHTLSTKGTMDVLIDRSGTTVSNQGTGQGMPPSTAGGTINVTGDNVTVNANGTDTKVNCASGASNTTVNANSGSSGTITYPQSSGYSGSVNYQAGAGNWSMQPR